MASGASLAATRPRRIEVADLYSVKLEKEISESFGAC